MVRQSGLWEWLLSRLEECKLKSFESRWSGLLTTLSKVMKAKQSKQSAHGKRIHPSRNMPIVNAHAAGIDISPNGHAVCVPEDSVPAGETPVREFGAFTRQLDNMVEWLRSCGVKSVAMDGTDQNRARDDVEGMGTPRRAPSLFPLRYRETQTTSKK
jgi:hypothetical protein